MILHTKVNLALFTLGDMKACTTEGNVLGHKEWMFLEARGKLNQVFSIFHDKNLDSVLVLSWDNDI